MRRFTWPLTCATLALLLAPAADAGTIVNRSAEGEFLSTGSKEANFATMGYFGLIPPPFTHRIYYLFDLTSVSGPITSAALRLELDRFFAGVDSLNFSIYDFGGTPDDLLLSFASGSAAGVTIFDDLGSGTLYGTGVASASQAAYRCTAVCSGTADGPGQILTLQLNHAAVNALNAALGGKFALGLRLDDESASDLYDGFKAVTFRFPFGTNPPVRVAELALNDVPEPSTFALMGAGLAAAAFLRRRK